MVSPFRPGHNLPPIEINFIIVEGGIGDYICSMSAIEHVAKTYPHVRGYLWVPDYFKEIADLVMKPYKHWAINTRSKLSTEILRSRPLMAPTLEVVNAMGSHLVDIGYIYYCKLIPPPGETFYPEYKGDGFSPTKDGRPHAIITPGATDENRQMPPTLFNKLKDYLIDKGVTPVFLGSSRVGNRQILYNEEYNYRGGIDLRDKTTLTQALQIIKNAQVVIGIDNGLLHLAGMTETPIVFGYTIAAPWHRRPRRKKGAIVDVHPSIEKLPCTFCQSRMDFMEHNFHYCVYGDNKCIDEISDPNIWIKAINEVINAGYRGREQTCEL